MDKYCEHDINTGAIYSDLCSNWGGFPRPLFLEIEDKLQSIFISNDTIPYTTGDEEYFEGKNRQLGAKIKRVQSETNPPFTDFCILENKNQLIRYSTSFILSYSNGKDYFFDFFFALKLLLTDEMKLKDFLIYQFKINFKNVSKDYIEFLETLLIKYELLKNSKVDVIVNKYLTNLFTNINLIENNNVSIEKDSENIENVILKTGIIVNNENPQNPFPEIFTSLRGYKIFEAFRIENVTPELEYSCYSFLFSRLKNDNFIHEMKHMKFMLFLEKEYSSIILSKGYSQFNASSSKNNIQIYSRYKMQIQ